MTDMYSISVCLRAVAHILHYAEYIQGITEDADFYGALVEITSDYLYVLSKDTADSFEINDKADCERSFEFSKLQEKIEQMTAELDELKQKKNKTQPEETKKAYS